MDVSALCQYDQIYKILILTTKAKFFKVEIPLNEENFENKNKNIDKSKVFDHLSGKEKVEDRKY